MLKLFIVIFQYILNTRVAYYGIFTRKTKKNSKIIMSKKNLLPFIKTKYI